MSTPTDRPDTPADEPIAIEPEHVAAPRRRALQLAGGLGATVAIVVVIALIVNFGSGSSTRSRDAGDNAGLILAVQSSDAAATTTSSTTGETTTSTPSTTAGTATQTGAAPAAGTSDAMPPTIAAITGDGNLVVLDSTDGHVIRTLATGLKPPNLGSGKLGSDTINTVSPSGDGATIYYSRFVNNTCNRTGPSWVSEIDRVPTAGGTSEPVVGEANFPLVSPDGRFLAYSSAGCAGSHALVVRDLASGAERRAPDNSLTYVPRSWAADSRSVIAALSATDSIDASGAFAKTALVDVSGAQLVLGPQACCFMVGSRVVGPVRHLQARNTENTELYAAEVASLPQRQADTGGGSSAVPAGWKKIGTLSSINPVVDIDASGHNVLQLGAVDPENQNPVTVTLTRASIGQPSDRPAQRVVLAHGLTEMEGAAWIPSGVAAPAPAPATAPTTVPCPTPAPSTSAPTGNPSTGGGAGGSPPGYGAPPGPGAPTSTQSAPTSTAPTARCNTSGPRLVLLDPADGHVVRVVVSSLDVSGPHSISVSSDGQTAYVARRTVSQCPSSQVPSAEIVEVSLRGTGEPRVITSALSPYVSPDGKQLAYFVSGCPDVGAGPKRMLAVRDLATGVVHTRDGIAPLAWSPDSKTIVGRSYATQGIELVDATSPTLDGKPLALVGMDPIGYIGDQLVGVQHTNGDEIVSIDTATGRASSVRARIPAGSTVADVNADGDLLLFSAETATSSGTSTAGPTTWTLSQFHAGRVERLGAGVAAAAWVPALKAVAPTTSTTEQAPQPPQGGSRLSSVEQSPGSVNG